MTSNEYQDELKYLTRYDIPKNKKIEFVENLYKLANMIFTQQLKNWQKNIKK